MNFICVIDCAVTASTQCRCNRKSYIAAVKYLHASFIGIEAASKTAHGTGEKNQKNEDITNQETLQLMSLQHVVTMFSVIQKLLSECLFSDRTEPYIPHEGVQLLYTAFCECPLHSRVHRFTFPRESCFLISPIKYMEILSSSTRQKKNFFSQQYSIFYLFCFPNSSIDLRFTWNLEMD